MTHHGAGLRRLGKSEAFIDQLISDYTRADISASEKAMLDYVAKLTLTPYQIQQADIQNLQAAGFSEAAILDICQIAAYYAFVNRLADGLGVELEAYWSEAEKKLPSAGKQQAPGAQKSPDYLKTKNRR